VSLGSQLDDALDQAPKQATVEVTDGERRAEVDVTDVDRLGVKVRRVKVHRQAPRPIAEEARALPERLRSLPERVEPVEVDPELGGASLRSRPGDMRDREFFQVDIEGEDEVEVRRYKAKEGGREELDWVMTRGQLGRLLDELD